MARTEIRIEDAGSSEELEIIDVSVEVGQSVAAGAELLEVATDKANMTIEAPADAVVAELPVNAGDIVAPDAVLIVLETA